MRFEVINSIGNTVFWTEHYSCIPSTEQLTLMAKNQYKFRLDGKSVSASKISELTELAPRSDVPKAIKSNTKKLF